MKKNFLTYPFAFLCLLIFVLGSCKGRKQKPPSSDIASSPEQVDVKAKDLIRGYLEFAAENEGSIGDSITLSNLPLLQRVYTDKQFEPFWSSKESWKPAGDSMVALVRSARLYGLFPEDYYGNVLDSINTRFVSDKWKEKSRRDAALWSKADIILTNAFFNIIKDVRLGRLPKDSITLRKDSVLSDSFYMSRWAALQQDGSPAAVLQPLEPSHWGYKELKAALPAFLNSEFNKKITPVPFARKDSAAKAVFRKALQTRLFEEGLLAADSTVVDSANLAKAIKEFQKQQGIVVDGKAGDATIRLLNLDGPEKFMRIAITMDRYKLLPDSMPPRYVWVNLPSYSMRFLSNDTLKIMSKIICGKPQTRTPLLTSAISEMITYPQWTVPNSIIVKEILPAAKKDPGYFKKKGFSLVDKDGNEVDPFTVYWDRYTKGIPYKVVQGSGDDNALGVLKFNFNNKYAVYLHDTNQRHLFGQAVRSLSHGCVRVQEWQQLAQAILQYDNKDEKKLEAKTDSLNAWLERKEKHSIAIRNRLPVYIRYFSCEAKDGRVVFYDDMYGEDRLIKEKYFTRRQDIVRN